MVVVVVVVVVVVIVMVMVKMMELLVTLFRLQSQPDNFTLATKLPCVVVRCIPSPTPLHPLQNCNTLRMSSAPAMASTAATPTIRPRSSTLKARAPSRSCFTPLN